VDGLFHDMVAEPLAHAVFADDIHLHPQQVLQVHEQAPVIEGEFNLEAQRRAEDFGRGSIVKTFSGTIIQLHRNSCNTLVTNL